MILRIHHQGSAQTWILGEPNTVLPFSIGSDPENDIVIADPAVPAFITTFQFGGHHGIIHSGGRVPLEPVAGYRIAVSWTDDLGALDREGTIGTRLEFHRGLAPAHTLDDADPRRIEATRIGRAVKEAHPDLDEARCEDRIVEHVRALNHVTRSRPPVTRARIEYTSDLDVAIDRFVRAWSAEDAAPFAPAVWSYVQRYHAFAGLVLSEQGADIATGMALASEISMPWRAFALHDLVGLHLGYRDEESPFRPLVELLCEGVITLALSGGAFVLCAQHAVPPRTALGERIAREQALAEEPEVLADVIEQGGEPRRALLVRSGVRIALQRHELANLKWFRNARSVMLAQSQGGIEPTKPSALAEITPPAWLGVEGRAMVLGRTNIFHIERGQLRIDPINDEHSNITCRGASGTFWLDQGEFYGMQLNGAPVRFPTPLFEGDLVRVRATYASDTIRTIDTIATFHLGYPD